MGEIVIFGTGLLADVAYFYLTKDSSHKVVAFTADKEFITKEKFHGLPLVSFQDIEKQYPPNRYNMLIAIGYNKLNKLRAIKYFEAKAKGYKLISYVSSKSVLWDDTEIGDNCFILENQTIQPYVKIGNNVTIWSGNHIGHHSVIMEHCFIASHVVISGSVRIEPYCFIGVNATIVDSIKIARDCIIGAGALIVRDTKQGCVYRGNPAEFYSNDSSTFFQRTKVDKDH